MEEYTPSAADAPDGPRNNRDELEEIDARTAEFEAGNGAAEYEPDTDPFSPTNAPKLALVVNMRIYDVLMALLNEKDPEAATRLHEIHSEGRVVGSLPYIDLTGE